MGRGSNRLNVGQRIVRPIGLGLVIDGIQASLIVAYLQLQGAGQQKSDSAVGKWDLQAQLFWLTVLLIASIVVLYIAVRIMGLPSVAMSTIAVVIVQVVGCAAAAAEVPGPHVLRLAVIAAVLPLELLVLTIGLSGDPKSLSRQWLAALQGFPPPGRSNLEAERPHPPMAAARSTSRRITAAGGVGLRIGFAQLVLVVFFEYWGVYEPPANFVRLRLDNELLWFTGLVGAPSILMVHFALRHFGVRFATALAVPAVFVQFEVCAVIGTQVASFGYFALMCAGVLPAELIVLSLILGKTPAPNA